MNVQANFKGVSVFKEKYDHFIGGDCDRLPMACFAAHGEPGILGRAFPVHGTSDGT
jgi:hypothetical protein